MNSLPIWNITKTAVNDPGYNGVAVHPAFERPVAEYSGKEKVNTKMNDMTKAYILNALRRGGAVRGLGVKRKRCGGSKLKKGSPEAKAYMAKLRAMRGKGVPGGKSLSKRSRKLKGGLSLTEAMPFLLKIMPYLGKTWKNREAVGKLLRHLLAMLRFGVKSVREGRDMTGYNYPAIWESLKHRFDDALNKGKYSPSMSSSEGEAATSSG